MYGIGGSGGNSFDLESFIIWIGSFWTGIAIALGAVIVGMFLFWCILRARGNRRKGVANYFTLEVMAWSLFPLLATVIIGSIINSFFTPWVGYFFGSLIFIVVFGGYVVIHDARVLGYFTGSNRALKIFSAFSIIGLLFLSAFKQGVAVMFSSTGEAVYGKIVYENGSYTLKQDGKVDIHVYYIGGGEYKDKDGNLYKV